MTSTPRNCVAISNPCDNKKGLSHGRFANAARTAGNFVANNALAFFGAKWETDLLKFLCCGIIQGRR